MICLKTYIQNVFSETEENHIKLSILQVSQLIQRCQILKQCEARIETSYSHDVIVSELCWYGQSLISYLFNLMTLLMKNPITDMLVMKSVIKC
jgi:hypothetical protein